MTSLYEKCPSCAELREAGDFESVLKCCSCKGTGLRRRDNSFRCNRCGGAMGVPHDASPYGLVEQTVSGAYLSTHLLDTTTYTFSLCELCLRCLFDECVIPPTIGSYMGAPAERDYAEERASYEWHTWRGADGHRPRVREGRCNQTIACESPATIWMISSDGLTDEVSCEEHAKRCSSSSYYEVPYAKAKAADEAGLLAMADLWFRTSAWPAPTVTSYLHVPDCALEALGIEDDAYHPKLSAVWVPTDVAPFHYAPILTNYGFPHGHLLVGPTTHVRELRHADLRDASVLNRHLKLDDE